MIAMQVARIIADFSLFLDLTGEDQLDLDAAVEMAEWMGERIAALDKPFLREVVDAFAVIAPEYQGEAQQLVKRIPHGYYLEEALAEGDPVRLAELEAERDAED